MNETPIAVTGIYQMAPVAGLIASACLLSEVLDELDIQVIRREIPDGKVREQAWLERACGEPSRDVGDDAATVTVANGASCWIRSDDEGQSWQWHWPLDSPEELERTLDYCERITVELAGRGLLLAARWNRDEGLPRCLPEVPLARRNIQGRFCTRAQIEARYDDVDGFLSAWQTTPVGNGYLLTRGRGAYDRVAYLAAIRDSQWNLARIARPGTVEHQGRPPTEEEMGIWGAGESRLQPVGYLPDLAAVEYAAYLGSGQHIHGWEIDQLRWLRAEGRLGDGRPVRDVRVSFPRREMAEAEKRLLLDIGVRVLYMEDGDEYELNEH